MTLLSSSRDSAGDDARSGPSVHNETGKPSQQQMPRARNRKSTRQNCAEPANDKKPGRWEMCPGMRNRAAHLQPASIGTLLHSPIQWPRRHPPVCRDRQPHMGSGSSTLARQLGGNRIASRRASAQAGPFGRRSGLRVAASHGLSRCRWMVQHRHVRVRSEAAHKGRPPDPGLPPTRLRFIQRPTDGMAPRIGERHRSAGFAAPRRSLAQRQGRPPSSIHQGSTGPSKLQDGRRSHSEPPAQGNKSRSSRAPTSSRATLRAGVGTRRSYKPPPAPPPPIPMRQRNVAKQALAG